MTMSKEQFVSRVKKAQFEKRRKLAFDVNSYFVDRSRRNLTDKKRRLYA